MSMGGHNGWVNWSLREEVGTLSLGSWDLLKTFVEKKGLVGLYRSSEASMNNEIENWILFCVGQGLRGKKPRRLLQWAM